VKKKQKVKVSVVDWISEKEADIKECSIGGLGGFFSDGMRWKDYADKLTSEALPYANAIRQSVIEKNIRLTGNDHQYSDEGVPLFSDGTVGQFSFRAWGDIMAAIWSEKENKDYCYMSFYM
jgi:hypothetical protein